MCGRFTLSTSAEVVGEFFELDVPLALAPRYNVAPTQSLPAVVADASGSRSVKPFHWGLVPSWAKDPAIGSRMINARGETIASKPSFRSAFSKRRCLIPADGFYEWQKLGGRKQPHLIRLNDEQVFAFAGLWERWNGPDGDALESCTIITTEPNDLMAPIHNRMPVILPSDRFGEWLDPQNNAIEALTPMLCAYPSGEMHAVPVSTFVNSPTHDDARCLEPIDPNGADEAEPGELFPR